MPKPLLAAIAALAFVSGAQAQEEVDTVTALFTAAFSEMCFFDGEDPGAGDPPDQWTFTYTPSYADDEESITLYRFFCFAGAYNVSHVYYVVDPMDGVLPLPFAEPSYRVDYENDDFEAAVLGIEVTGFTTRLALVNSDFDPETLTVSSHTLWRGIGDASSGGTWRFEDGDFVLESFDVDASYDGEINPETIVSYP